MHLSDFSRWTKKWLVEKAHEARDLTSSRRRITGILRPRTKEEVQEIVRHAGRSAGVRLQPVSCGKNWGFGSALPDQNDVYILDLSALNRIPRLDLDEHRIELEPGVTQGQLDAALEQTGRSHTFNVTGAGLSASVLGNALERGIGYIQQRDLDILELEIVTGTGEILRTSRFDSSMAGRHRGGLGPDPLGLFTQSSWAVVTGATLALRQRPAHMGSVSVAMSSASRLPAFFTELSKILAEGWLQCIPHVFNDHRLTTTFAPHAGRGEALVFPPWSALIPIAAPLAVAAEMVREIEPRFSSLGIVTSPLLPIGAGDDVQPATSRTYPAVLQQELGKLAQGIPTNVALPSVAWAGLQKRVPSGSSSANPELDSSAGLIHITPTCPLAGGAPLELLRLVDKVRSKHQRQPLPMTFNVISCRLAALVISIPFDRARSEDVIQAKEFARDLLHSCCAARFAPYRLGIEPQAPESLAVDAPWQRLFGAIQQQMDPHHVFASGKYNRLWETHVVPC